MNPTLNTSWQTLRSLVTVEDVALTDYKASSFPVAKAWKRGLGDGMVKIMIFGSISGATGTFSWKIWSKPSVGPLEIVAAGTGALGAVPVGVHPISGDALDATFVWANTLVIVDEPWVQPVDITDSGQSRIAKISFDGMGLQQLFLEITGIGDEGEAVSIEAIIAPLRG